MTEHIRELAGLRVLELGAAGAPITDRREVSDLIGAAWAERADLVAIPVSRQGAAFFDLKTRVAGEMLQMFVNYGLRLAFVGAMPAEVTDSRALRDFIFESNKGRSVWFVEDMAALERRLAAA